MYIDNYDKFECTILKIKVIYIYIYISVVKFSKK